MINVVTLGGPRTQVRASLVGREVVVLAYVCPSHDVQRGVFHELVRQIARREITVPAAEPTVSPPEADPFTPGVKVGVSVYDWDAGERRLDAVVVSRISDDELQLRTRFGQVMKAKQNRVRLGWSAH